MTTPQLPDVRVPQIAWPQAFPFPAITGGYQPVAGDTLVTGWSMYETTGSAAAAVEVIDGNDGNGLLVSHITLQPGQSMRDTTGFMGLYFRTGVYVNVLSGSVKGSIWGVDI